MRPFLSSSGFRSTAVAARARSVLAIILSVGGFARSAITQQVAVPTPAAPTITVSPNLRTVAGEHNETWVAVSSTDPNIILAVAQQSQPAGATGQAPRSVSTVISRDGGRTWARVNLPNASAAPFDPMVTSGPDGRLYVMQGVIGSEFTNEPGPIRNPVIRVWSSADGGWTWDGPTELKSAVDQDHPRMTVDMSRGPHRGRLYIAWNDVADRFVRNQFEVFLQWSDDKGKTFSDPVLIDTRKDGKLVATEPVVLSNGTLLVTYYQYMFPLGSRKNEHMPMYVVRSTDGAKTFEPPIKVFELGPHTWRTRLSDFPRAFSLPTVTADTSSRSSYRDRIYAAWDDVRGGTSNIWLARSLDGGRTWSAPLRVNDNPEAPATGVADFRMTPVVAVSPTGEVGVAWYDRRNDPNRLCWDYFFASSRDGGMTFGPNQRVSTAASCPPPNVPPSVAVHNISPRLRDPNQLPDSLRRGSASFQELAVAEAQAAQEERFQGLPGPRIAISFDPARNTWPGHYTGLAADKDGVFNAVWIDRRSGQSELYAARVITRPPERPADLAEGDVSRQIEVVAGTATFDRTKNTVTVPLQLRNAGEVPVYGPMNVRIHGVGSVAGLDTTIAFAGKIGTGDRLLPRDLSEPVSVTMSVKPAAGYDAAFDFRVTGATAARPSGVRSNERRPQR